VLILFGLPLNGDERLPSLEVFDLADLNLIVWPVMFMAEMIASHFPLVTASTIEVKNMLFDIYNLQPEPISDLGTNLDIQTLRDAVLIVVFLGWIGEIGAEQQVACLSQITGWDLRDGGRAEELR